MSIELSWVSKKSGEVAAMKPADLPTRQSPIERLQESKLGVTEDSRLGRQRSLRHRRGVGKIFSLERVASVSRNFLELEIN